MGGGGLMKIVFYLLIVVAAVAFVVWLVAKAKESVQERKPTRSTPVAPKEEKAAAKPETVQKPAETHKGPRIVIEYERDGGIFEDGKCGWLDVEREDGEERTVKLNFDKKSPVPITVPLEIAVYRITYRTQSKAAMAASGILNAINEGNGAMGAFANAVYDAGGMNGKLDSVVVKVEEGFVLRLRCTTDGLTKSCTVISTKE